MEWNGMAFLCVINDHARTYVLLYDSAAIYKLTAYFKKRVVAQLVKKYCVFH
jgi:hypothetical protein